MISAFFNIFKIPDLKKKVLFTLSIVAVYRVGAFIPTPGIDGNALSNLFQEMARSSGGGGNLFGMMNMFSGGAMRKMTIFALGIMPYISSSIIIQLLMTVIPHLEKLAKEGEMGRRKITQYTRYGTVVLSVIQSFFISLWLENQANFSDIPIVASPGIGFRLLVVITLTSGTAFIMWLGEQITEKGVGNGMSLIIAAGIIAGIPTAIQQTWYLINPTDLEAGTLSPVAFIFMVIVLVSVVAGVVSITQGQRKIPVQYAKRVVGRKVYQGQSTFIPLKVNQAGVIPIIFAISIMMFPATIAAFVQTPFLQKVTNFIQSRGLGYNTIYVLLIFFFTYFYTAITFNPLDISENMKRTGAFIPGIRPGKATTDYLDQVMTRITFSGALFISFIAVMPDIVYNFMHIPPLVASFFGGTGLLIVVGVMLDSMRQIETQLLTRHYDGFMKKGRLHGRSGV